MTLTITVFSLQEGDTISQRVSLFGQSIENLDKAYKSLSKETDNWKTKTLNAFKSVSEARKAAALETINESFNWGDDGSDIGNENKKSIENWVDAFKGNDAEAQSEAYSNASKAVKDYIDTCKDGEVSLDGFKKHQTELAQELENTGASAKIASIGMKALEVAMNIGVMLAVSAAIKLVTWGIDQLIHRSENLRKKQSELYDSYKESKDSLDEINNELKTNVERMKELQGLSDPTYVDKQELGKLKQATNELKAQKEYYEYIQKYKQADLAKGATKSFNDTLRGASFSKKIFTGVKGEDSYFEAELKVIKEAQEEVERYKTIKADMISKGEQNRFVEGKGDVTPQELETNIKAKNGLIKEYTTEVTSYISVLEETLNGINYGYSEETDKLFDKLYQMKARIAAINGDTDVAIGQLFSYGKFSDIGQDLTNAANDAESFNKALKEVSDNEELLKLLNDLGISLEDVSHYFTKGDENGSSIISTANKEFKELADLSNFIDVGGIFDKAKDDAQRAYEESASSPWVDIDMNQLLNLDGEAFENRFEDYFGSLGSYAKGFLHDLFTSNSLDSYSTEQLEQYSNSVASLISQINEFYDYFAKSTEENAKKSSEATDKLNEAFGGNLQGVDGNIDTLEEYSTALSAVADTYQTLKSAMAEQDEQGQLSLQTTLSLLEKNEDYAQFLSVDETGAIHLATDAQEKMVMTQIQRIQASMDAAIATKQDELTALQFKQSMANFREAVKSGMIDPLTACSAVAGALGKILKGLATGQYKFSDVGAVLTQEVNKALNSVQSQLTAGKKYDDNINALKSDIAKLQAGKDQLGKIKNPTDFYNHYSSPTSKSSGSSSSSSSDDPRLKAWNEMLAVKKHQLEMDQITEEQYYAWLEANYKKQLNNQKKYAEEWRKYEEEIYKWKKQKRLDDWNEAVDLKKHELEMGKIDEGEYYAWLAANYKKYLNDKTKYAEEWRKNEEEIHKFEEQQAKDSQDALEDLIDLRIDMLKQEKNNEKDVLKERQDNVKDFYDKQRDLLKEHYDQIDKEEERREKRKKVTDIQAELLELEADDSVEAQKRRLELEESLSDAKKDLNDFERDEELDKAEKMYDDLEEMQTQYYEKQIEAIEDYLDNAYELRQQAIEDLQNGNAQLYQEMIEYNRAYGDGIDRSITEKWEAAYEALNRYNSLLDDNYGMKLDNMTGYNKGKYETAAEREARERATQRTSAKDAAQTIAKNAGKSSGSSNTSRKSGPSRGDKVTIKKSATHFSSQSGNAKMASHVPGGRYTVYQVKGNQVLIGVNGAYTGWVWKSDIQGYATGTPYAKGGIANIDEKGLELILGSPDKGRYKFLNDGDKVFNAKASEFLYKWANQPGEVLGSMIKSLSTASSVSIASPCNITVGDVVINGSADEKTVGELRRAHKQIVTDILNEFKKMKK